MKKETILIGAAAAGLFMLCAKKRKATEQPATTEPTIDITEEAESVRYIPLESIRRGIAEKWYKAEIAMPSETEFIVILHGLLVDGSEFVEKYPITKETFEALKADGVPAV